MLSWILKYEKGTSPQILYPLFFTGLHICFVRFLRLKFNISHLAASAFSLEEFTRTMYFQSLYMGECDKIGIKRGVKVPVEDRNQPLFCQTQISICHIRVCSSKVVECFSLQDKTNLKSLRR